MRAMEVNGTYRQTIGCNISATITLLANANNTIIVENSTDEVHELIIEIAQREIVSANEDIQPSGSGKLTATQMQ